MPRSRVFYLWFLMPRVINERSLASSGIWPNTNTDREKYIAALDKPIVRTPIDSIRGCNKMNGRNQAAPFYPHFYPAFFQRGPHFRVHLRSTSMCLCVYVCVALLTLFFPLSLSSPTPPTLRTPLFGYAPGSFGIGPRSPHFELTPSLSRFLASFRVYLASCCSWRVDGEWRRDVSVRPWNV